MFLNSQDPTDYTYLSCIFNLTL